jgi:UrcA family protein
MKTSGRSILVVSTLVLFGWTAATVAAPSRANDVATKTVRFGDLDLSTALGAERLYERIAAAARIVCRGAPHGAVRECRTRAVDDAVSGVGSPLLSSIHRSTANGVEEVVRR